MSAPLRFKFVTSGDDVWRLPPTRAEVAFLGRSNVGKSSLLNALANHKRLAHTSKTPGRTQLLNLFELGNGTTAVDLPGYGFAAVPGKTRSGWQQMIEGYLLEREHLEMVLVLVDGEIGPTKLDVQMLGWLQAHGLPHTVVASKYDKVKPSKRGVRQHEVSDGCNVAPESIVWVSAAKGTGIEKLRGLIVGWLAEGAAANAEPAPPTKAELKAAKAAAAAAPPADPADDEDEWN
ncbi:ribosome biogenesis GTP-binding protein YihA/YsxC [Aquihabitans sp. G128]|uniref:ribosome biogenesis GTP-binding protein YihA/YsxC n=1 Tax=Aquihabitans sp. G128 TaxID=2849779 RepID=UPI001C243B9F|nr:ribosome biogenesis GTP-binding protein YihA/YsxC [Aquihabitans sp. G128]QXC61738.1 ribosome biogenesis GTP-binding protein YihA/YsxC [Aquihabitans sp. G128]